MPGRLAFVLRYVLRHRFISLKAYGVIGSDHLLFFASVFVVSSKTTDLKLLRSLKIKPTAPLNLQSYPPSHTISIDLRQVRIPKLRPKVLGQIRIKDLASLLVEGAWLHGGVELWEIDQELLVAILS